MKWQPERNPGGSDLKYVQKPLNYLVNSLSAAVPEAEVSAFDGSRSGPIEASLIIRISSPAAIYQMIRAPRGLGLARAWVSGQIEVSGDPMILTKYENELASWQLKLGVLNAALALMPKLNMSVMRDTGPTPIEYRKLRPGLHSISSDLAEVDHHYSLPATFYAEIIGASMTYSCGIFNTTASTLDEAQQNKHQIIARKLEVTRESTVLDVGCGWGGFIQCLTSIFGCRAIGVTASIEQYNYLRNTDLSTKATVIHADYRQALPIDGATCAASIGMYEHVGINESLNFFERIKGSLPPGGLFLNQAVTTYKGLARLRSNGFMQRYIFPNGHVLPLSRQLRDIESAGLKIRTVETYGEHYAQTIDKWRANLNDRWDLCEAIVGPHVLRSWAFYLAGSKARFENGDLDLAQVLTETRR